MLGYIMTKDMSAKQIGYLQTFADFGHDIGVVPEKVDVQAIPASRSDERAAMSNAR